MTVPPFGGVAHDNITVRYCFVRPFLHPVPRKIAARYWRYPNHFPGRDRQDLTSNLPAGSHFNGDLNPSDKIIAR